MFTNVQLNYIPYPPNTMQWLDPDQKNIKIRKTHAGTTSLTSKIVSQETQN